MKLNPDCIREILLLVEKEVGLSDYISLGGSELPDALSQFTCEEVLYHVKQCELSGMFGAKVSWTFDGNCLIPYLSPEGHKFISDIHADNNWTKTKEIARNVGANSLDSLKEIATGVITSLIQNQLGLQ